MSAVPGQATDQHFWERTSIGWHVVFAAVMGTLVVSALIADDLDQGRTTGLLALTLSWSAWYGLVAGPLLHQEVSQWRARLYLWVAVALFLALVGLSPTANFALFILVPQIYALIESLREAVATMSVLMVGFGAVLVSAYADTTRAGLEIAGGVAASMGLSALLGVWISGIIRQSGRRAELIAELESTRERLAAVNHEKGALAERERLSQDIHDTLAQGFTSIVMLLQAVEAKVGSDDEGARRHLQLAQQTARENLTEARSLVATLTPAGLAASSLPEAVRRLVSRFAEELELSASLSVRGSPRPLSQAGEVVLLRAAQESLANVRKHASARTVAVSLYYAEDAATLTVADDGRGFDPALAVGFGLRGMQSRVEQVGGSMGVHSHEGEGTTIEVRVP